MNLLKNLARGNTSPVKSISSILFALAMLQAFSASASDRSRRLCVDQPLFERPNFETGARESRQRQTIVIEKPIFEKAKFQREQIARPVFEKLVLEKSAFQRECIESASLISLDKVEATKEFAPFPTTPPQKWRAIKSENRRIRFISNNRQLRGNAAPIYR